MAVPSAPPAPPPSGAADVPLSPAEERKRLQLVTTRRRATVLLAAVAAVFAGTVVAGAEDGSAMGYLQATAEASMVGGLADWFAVVALFRHPLGLPIPHTAIIPERKEQFGETLGDFIQSSFLTPEAVVERVQLANVGDRVARWLADPLNAERLAAHAADGAVQVADLLRDEDVQDVLDGLVRRRVEATPLAPLAGRALGVVTREGRHEEVLDAGLRSLERYLDDHRHELRSRFEARAPWWLPGAVEDRIFERLLDGARAVLDDMVHDRQHDLRRQLDARLAQLVVDLQTSPELKAKGDRIARDLLEQPELRSWVAGMWTDAKTHLRSQADDPSSELRRHLARAIGAGGQRMLNEPALSASVQNGAEAGARYVVEHFGSEISQLVSGTIARWDGEETARRLELLLGPDLQYIRINGTVVGGLAGLLLHAIAQAFG
ncbi:MAG: DUF445 domain-containing protein [Acidimicrobiales bacterium]|nr:DUF445 domain-containing protein [Acidimicrobiales bacterium]